MAGVSRHQLFAVAHDHLHGPTRRLRQEIHQGNVHEGPLPPEVSAQRKHVDFDFVALEAQAFAQVVEQQKRRLVRGPDMRHAAPVELD